MSTSNEDQSSLTQPVPSQPGFGYVVLSFPQSATFKQLGRHFTISYLPSALANTPDYSVNTIRMCLWLGSEPQQTETNIFLIWPGYGILSFGELFSGQKSRLITLIDDTGTFTDVAPNGIAHDLLWINRRPCLLFIWWSTSGPFDSVVQEAEKLSLKTVVLAMVGSLVTELIGTGNELEGDAIRSPMLQRWYAALLESLKSVSKDQFLFDPTRVALGIVRHLGKSLMDKHRFDIRSKPMLYIPMAFIRVWAEDLEERAKTTPASTRNFKRSSASSISEITSVQGNARPGDQSAHEHFGYLDGVSNPAIIGFDTNPPPRPAPVRAGAIILGQDGDESKTERAPWMVDGSFLVFRYLFQKVPEFDDFAFRNRLKGPGMSDREGADLLEARLIGRWKSGAPVDLSPFQDDPELGADLQRNNNFHFSAELNFQKLCPFAAHIRKTLPHADLESLGISIERNRIMRRGIQFGPEVTRAEKLAKKTFHGRGLIFACYQSSITNGFQFLQSSWVNNATFPFAETTPEVPGLDPILGQGKDRKLTGTDPNNPAAVLKLDDEWVIPRGGEYFFSPSIKGLTDTIAA